jgi:ectoine hydroxylase-related dioxygenase (phytanoyl-CoA dioxygenase family)
MTEPAALLARAAGQACGDEARARFERDGYLVVDTGIDAATLDRAVADLAPLYTAPGQPPDTSGQLVPYRDHVRVQDAWRTLEAVKAIALAPALLAQVAALYGRRPQPFQTLNFRVGSEQRPHSDTIHFNATPAGYMCGLWVALEDIDMTNGPLVYYPGSHRLTEVTLQDVDRALAPAGDERGTVAELLGSLRRKKPRDTTADYLRYEAHIATVIEGSGIAPHHALLKKGQALIWAANLLHGGSPHTDRSRTRHSQVTHVFFEGCRYYTPLMSERFRKHWRNPTWIT